MGGSGLSRITFDSMSEDGAVRVDFHELRRGDTGLREDDVKQSLADLGGEGYPMIEIMCTSRKTAVISARRYSSSFSLRPRCGIALPVEQRLSRYWDPYGVLGYWFGCRPKAYEQTWLPSLGASSTRLHLRPETSRHFETICLEVLSASG